MSREKKFTPGPWEVQTFEGGLTDIIAPHHSHWAVAEQVQQKDANLIAAAPELLKELESHCAACMARNNFALCSGCFTQRAIKKAYGETE